MDGWLAELFDPDGIDTTVEQIAGQVEQLDDPAVQARAEAARERIATFDGQIKGYRASIDAGGDPAVVGPWIAETQAKKIAAQAEIRAATGQRRMSRDEIAAVVAAFGDLARVVERADPADKADIYAKLQLSLVYQPGEKLVEATIQPGLNMLKGFVSEAPPVPDQPINPPGDCGPTEVERPGSVGQGGGGSRVRPVWPRSALMRSGRR